MQDVCEEINLKKIKKQNKKKKYKKKKDKYIQKNTMLSYGYKTKVKTINIKKIIEKKFDKKKYTNLLQIDTTLTQMNYVNIVFKIFMEP